MHRFLLPKGPCLEERLRKKSDVEVKEMPGVSGVDFYGEERCGQGGQPSTTTEGANHGASSISDISMNAQDGPRRPKLQKYPPCMFGVQQRSFCKSLLEQFAWLEYSVTKVLLAVY